ncbi:MAG TPA: hypothetical protein VGS22_28990 [Thermoanaerobaculia bacterium]|jgi:hypothetical protein|nr:hypothetical protein [Thermoanaerobaculia bacterium]
MSDPKFNSPNDTPHAAKAGAVEAEAAAVATAAPLVGTWQACNKATRGIVRVEITEKAGALTVQVFGACTPTPCDWGAVKGLAYATSVSGGPAIAFTAIYTAGFKDTIVTGLLDAGSLLVENYNTFKDGSGRANYYDRGYFCKR